MTLEQLLQDVNGFGIVAPISRYERQVVVGRNLVGLQPCALSKVVRRFGQAPLKVQDGSQRVLQLGIAGLLRDHDRARAAAGSSHQSGNSVCRGEP